jgi:replication factor C subunit 3/5
MFDCQLVKEVGESAIVGDQTTRFKVVVINDADTLSRQAQAALRRTMEKRSQACRIILVSESLSKLIGPVRSRCLCLRVGAPTEEEGRHKF